ncbi:unnamed protein product [Hermetia illucens]|uniref:Uncharacterized protein n=1 Tax=Hermetia illucens TaxID=343691 RepID=A0A7R8UHW3_HERIL|nr:unnamed protein product [Hermetia illucens]
MNEGPSKWRQFGGGLTVVVVLGLGGVVGVLGIGVVEVEVVEVLDELELEEPALERVRREYQLICLTQRSCNSNKIQEVNSLQASVRCIRKIPKIK